MSPTTWSGEPLPAVNLAKPSKRMAVAKKAALREFIKTRAQLVAAVWKRDKGHCRKCGKKCVPPKETYPTDPHRGEVHDLVPRSLGGNPRDVANNQLWCHACHFSGKSGAHIGRRKQR